MSSLAQRGSFDFDEHLPEMPLLEFKNLTDLILFGFLDCILKSRELIILPLVVPFFHS